MKQHVSLTIGAGLVLGILTLSCSADKDNAHEQRPIAVNAQILAPTSQDVVTTFTGNLEGREQSVLYAKLSETVEKVLVKEGQRVQAGQILISLDKYGPSSRYNEARSVFTNDEKNFKKMEYLFKEGAVSESQFDGARTQYEVSKANFDAVQRLVEIHSPINGTVTAIDISLGAQVAAGQRVAVVATTDSLRVKFGVNSENVGSFQIGSDVTIAADAVADRAAGKVVAKASSADPTNRTFEVEALIDNAAGTFRPGMFVKVHLVREHLANVIVVPREAVVVLDNHPVVFTTSGGIARKQAVELGTEVDGHVVITSGLNAGDTVVTLGQTYLDDGFKVTIANLERGSL